MARADNPLPPIPTKWIQPFRSPNTKDSSFFKSAPDLIEIDTPLLPSEFRTCARMWGVWKEKLAYLGSAKKWFSRQFEGKWSELDGEIAEHSILNNGNAQLPREIRTSKLGDDVAWAAVAVYGLLKLREAQFQTHLRYYISGKLENQCPNKIILGFYIVEINQ